LTGHDELRHWLGAMVLGALNAEEAEELTAHLGECPLCRAEAAQLGDIPRLLKELAATAGPPTSMMTRPPAEARPPSWIRLVQRRWRVVVLGTLATAAVAALLVVMFRPVQGPLVLPLRPIDSAVRASGTVEYQIESWGTQLLIRTHNLPDAGRCTIWVVGVDGSWLSVGSWNSAAPEGSAIEAATVLLPRQIAAVVLETGGSRPLLRAGGPGEG